MSSNRWVGCGLYATLALFSLHASAALAQARPPDAGTILRETDPSRRPTPPSANPAPPATAAPSRSAQDEARVKIASIRIIGAARYGEEQLLELVKDLIGREVDYLELRRAADRITRHYRDAGWFARAYLPEQALQDGVLTIAVIEAHVGDVRIEKSEQSLRVREDFIRKMLLSRQQDQAALAITELERAALLVDELPGIKAAVVLAPGASEGATDIVARVENTPLMRPLVEADNRGIPSTGRARISSQLSVDSPARQGDAIGLLLSYSDGNEFGRLSYAVPLGADGWRVEASASALEYELEEEFRALDAHGRAATWGLNAEYPLIRSNALNARLSLGYEQRRYANFALSTETSRSKVRAGRARLGIDRLDAWGGGGVTLLSLQATAGSVDLSDNATNFAVDAATARSDGNYSKLAWNIARLQRLGDRDRLSLNLTGQVASRNLDSSEKLSIGGAYAVRAYPELEGTGDEGWIANLEWQRTLSAEWQCSVFYDYGSVTQHRRTWQGWNAENPSLDNHYTLDGPGLSVAWTGFPGLEVRAAAATRFGSNPGRDPLTGQDSDGSRREPQFWLSGRWQW